MLNNREISELFEVQVNTLYNWQKTKPKLFKYLQNADYNSSRNEEINILLDKYSQDMQKDFTTEEINYIIKSSLELVSIEEVKLFGELFMEKEYKSIPISSKIILSIYDKFKLMNIIEKYIFYKKIYKFREDKKSQNQTVEIYFKEFLQSN